MFSFFSHIYLVNLGLDCDLKWTAMKENKENRSGLNLKATQDSCKKWTVLTFDSQKFVSMQPMKYSSINAIFETENSKVRKWNSERSFRQNVSRKYCWSHKLITMSIIPGIGRNVNLEQAWKYITKNLTQNA